MITTSLYSIFEEAQAASSHMEVPKVEAAINELQYGKPIIVVDDESRENEGDLIMPAEMATPEWVAFIVRHTTGIICVALEDERADALNLPLMCAQNADSFDTAFTVTVDAAHDITTGVSASDRARTIKLLADPSAEARDFVRPGHVFPLRARKGGVLKRRGHTEAAVDLSRLAGFAPVGLLCELVCDTGEMMRGDAMRQFAFENSLQIVSIEALSSYVAESIATAR